MVSALSGQNLTFTWKWWRKLLFSAVWLCVGWYKCTGLSGHSAAHIIGTDGRVRLSVPMIKAAGSCKTSVHLHQTIRHHIPRKLSYNKIKEKENDILLLNWQKEYLRRDISIRETRMGQKVVQLHERYMVMMMMTKKTENWIMIAQLDVTCFIISPFNAQHVSNVSTSIFRSLWFTVDLFHVLYCSGSMCVGVMVWFG